MKPYQKSKRINRNLRTIVLWSKSHGLNLNTSESQYIIIGSNKQIAKLKTLLVLTPIPSTNYIKNLGIIMDNILYWASQILHVIRKIFATMRSLKKWKNFLPIRTKILLTTSLLLPIIDYADICYFDLLYLLYIRQEHLDSFSVYKISASHIYLGWKKIYHTSAFRDKLQWLTVLHRPYIHVLCTLYSILFHPNIPRYLEERFTFLSTDSTLQLNLRSKSGNKLKIPYNLSATR